MTLLHGLGSYLLYRGPALVTAEALSHTLGLELRPLELVQPYGFVEVSARLLDFPGPPFGRRRATTNACVEVSLPEDR
jgi:hypothetical protein